MRWIKRIGVGLLALVLIAVIGFFAWTRLARYSALPPAAALVAGPVQSSQGWYVFTPTNPTGSGLIIYPGGLVDPAAYAPLARAIAEQGALVVIVPMPLDLAVFSINAADPVLAAYPQVQRWALAGHSLGGSMAAQYIANHAANLGKVKGLVFWASYAPDGVDLSALPIKAVSIYGSRDGVMSKSLNDQSRLRGLPPGTRLVVIEGGNHGGFGTYGAQSGDQPAAIPAEDQQRQAAAATVALLAEMK